MGIAVESHAFLVTDIEESTLLWELDPAAMRVVLPRHDRILRDVIGRTGGVVFKNTGDGVWARFATGPAALAAALEIQDALCVQTWKGSLDLRVRMGRRTAGLVHYDRVDGFASRP